MREKKSLEEKYGRMEGEYTEYLKSRLPKFDTVLLQGWKYIEGRSYEIFGGSRYFLEIMRMDDNIQ